MNEMDKIKEKMQRAIDEYVANLSWENNLKTISRKPMKTDVDDYARGKAAAAHIQIQQGVGRACKLLQITE
jgi:hypothetical protein